MLLRTLDGHPNLEGFWLRDPAAGMAAWDVEPHEQRPFVPAGEGVIIDPLNGRIPYQAWALERRNTLRSEQIYDDPQAHCFLSGLPRHNYEPFGFQLLQPYGGEYVVFLYESFHAHRVVPIDGRPHIPDAIKLFNGDSRGYWESDTLVVDVSNLNGKTWLDMAGNFTSDEMHIAERYTPVDENTIRYTARIEDETMYTQPWTIEFDLERVQTPGYQIMEWACHEGERDLQHYTEDQGQPQGR